MANVRLSKRSVDDAPAPEKNDTYTWDTELKGFGLRVTPKGVKSYVFQYRMKGKPAKRVTLGGHGSPWTAETARKEAERRLIKVRQGIDPVEEERQKVEKEAQDAVDAVRIEKENEVLAFGAYAETFVDLYLKSNWKDSWGDGKRILKTVEPAFAGKTVRQISRSDVVGVLDNYADRPGMKKLVHSVLRKLFNWSADRGDIDISPIEKMKAPKALPARRRVLSPDELAAVWHSAEALGDTWRPVIRLLICTLQRREEVSGLDWSEVDIERGVWILPGERAKNDEPNLVPLNALAIAELKRVGVRAKGLVFTTTGETSVSGFSKAKKRLDELVLATLRKMAADRGDDPDDVSLPGWRYHDLRRTGATNLQALGVPVEVTEAVLNHISGTTSGIAGVYNLYKYEKEKIAALKTWSDKLTNLTRIELTVSKLPLVA